MLWFKIASAGVKVPYAAHGKVKAALDQWVATNKPVMNETGISPEPSADALPPVSPVQLSAQNAPIVYVTIDTLRLVQHIESPEVYAAVGQKLETAPPKYIIKAPVKQASKQGYYRAYTIVSAGNEAATLYCGRIGAKDSRQIALHLQVPRLEGASISATASALNCVLPHGLLGFLSQAHISEIDVAIDVPGLKLTDLIVNHMHAQQWQKVGKFTTGVQTIYIGSNNSKSRWRIYDRSAHVAVKPGFSSSSFPTVRFEKHMRGPLTLKDVAALTHGLSDLQVHQVQHYQPSSIFNPLEKALIKMLFHHNAWPDMQAVAATHLGQYFKANLMVNTASWWEPAKFWVVAKAVLDTAVNPCAPTVAFGD